MGKLSGVNQPGATPSQSLINLPPAVTAPTFTHNVNDLEATVFFTLHQAVTLGGIKIAKQLSRPMYNIEGVNLDLVKYQHQWKGGLTWMELKHAIGRAFKNIARDQNVLTIVKTMTMIRGLVPVRSGYLIDTIFNTMRIDRNTFYETRFWATFSFVWPIDRPMPIPTPQHIYPPSTGYGQRYRPAHTIPNIHLIRYTRGGNAFYGLNDPQALGDPTKEILSEAKQALFSDFNAIFQSLTVVIHIRTNLDTGEKIQL